MGRSSQRHKREIQGIDSAGELPEDHGDRYNTPSQPPDPEPTGGTTSTPDCKD